MKDENIIWKLKIFFNWYVNMLKKQIHIIVFILFFLVAYFVFEESKRNFILLIFLILFILYMQFRGKEWLEWHSKEERKRLGYYGWKGRYKEKRNE